MLLWIFTLCSLAIIGSPDTEAADTSAANDNIRLILDKTTLDLTDNAQGTFNVRLGTRPSADMRIRVSVSPSASGLAIDTDPNTTGDQDTLRFDRWGQNNAWNQNKQVSLAFDRDNAMNRQTFTVSLIGIVGPNDEDNDYVGKTASLGVATNIRFMLDETTLSVNEGEKGTFNVRLETMPSADMRVRLSVSPSGLAIDTDPNTTGNQDTLRFDRSGTTDPWNRYQAVSVATEHDNDGKDETFTISLTGIVGASNQDNDYVNKTASVAVTVLDDEEENIDRGPSSVDLTEGQSATIDVKLTAAPVAGTSVTVSATSPVMVSPGTLSFDSSNYRTAQTVTVTAQEDNDGTDGSAIVAFSARGGYNASAATQINVLDDDGSIDLSDEAVELIEGTKNGSFTVALGAPPASSATISITSDDPGAVKVSPATLTFSSSNHSTAQTVNLISVSDSDSADESVAIEVSATAGYRASNATKSISVLDARTGPIIVSRPQETVSVNEGGSATFTVRLGTKPNRNVSISLTKTNDDITLTPTSLTFTESNWDAQQTITVSASNDDDDTADESDTITLSATGGIISDDVTKRVTIVDNDSRGAIDAFDAAGASLAAGSAIVVDEGTALTFTVKLDHQPTASVAISAAKTNDDITLTPTSLTFTESNWDVPQSITITAAIDADTVDDTDMLTLSASGGIVASDWSATITVKERPAGTILVPSTVTVNERGFGIFHVSLDSAQTPSSVPVVVSLANTSDDFDLSPTSLTFAASNWSAPQSIVIAHRPDGDTTEDTSDDSDTITLSASGGIAASSKTVAVIVEGSIRGSIHTDPPRVIDIDEGETGSFSVTLDSTWRQASPLNAQVVVSLRSIHRKVTISPTSLTFSASDWDIPQIVTLTNGHDANTENEPDIIVLNASGGIDARRGTLLVNVKDDDIPSGSIVMSDAELVIEEGGLRVFGVRLSDKPNANDDVIVSLSKHSFGITLSSDALIFDASNWNTVQLVAVGAMQDDDIEDQTHTLILTVHGGLIASPKTKRIRVIDDDESGPDPVRSRALAFPSIAAQDDAALRVRCNQDIACIVHLDCSAQDDGSVFQGRLPGAIPAWGTHTLEAADIERYIGGSWSGKGRLGCALRSRAKISSQVWTRSGDGVLVNNSALIRSAPQAERHRADIESISSPDEADQSNLRIRCIAPAGEHCTETFFSCFDDQGRRYDGGVGTIVRLTTRHLHSNEVAAIIGHRWKGMGLSCEIRSDHPFTVQMLTRTGGGALVNNSATGSANR
ncbi:hypothetical protein [Thioalkalivibrio sp. HK1]|uniref:hypothetical protein n=1 Tax=Thioalkalivibrio sp. HK1 TaxID=1469245 RepID=UPI000472C823|nr:hypothetical protein [Thioalkalivibrio sp. HK1]